jgi:hypothetical protein
VPLYHIKPTVPPTAVPSADFLCEGCGKLLGSVRWRSDSRQLVAPIVAGMWPELADAVRQHERDCSK